MTNPHFICDIEVLHVLVLQLRYLQMDGRQANADDFQILAGVELHVFEEQLLLRCVRFEADQAEVLTISELREGQDFEQ